MLRQPGDQPDSAADIARLRTDSVAATPDDIVDQIGVDAGAFHQCLDRMRAKVCRMHSGQAAFLAPDGGADGVDDHGVAGREGHALLLVWCGR